LLLQPAKLSQQLCLQFPNMRCRWFTEVLFGELFAARQLFIDCRFFPLSIHKRKMRQSEQRFNTSLLRESSLRQLCLA